MLNALHRNEQNSFYSPLVQPTSHFCLLNLECSRIKIIQVKAYKKALQPIFPEAYFANLIE